MTLPLDTEALPPSGTVTRLPSLGSPELSTEYLARIKEILESMLGRRGNEWDRVVTFRDLHALGLRGGGGGNLVINMGEAADLGPGYGNFVSRVQAEIENSAAFKNLKRRIGSAEDLAHLPDEIKRQLQLALGAVARERRADIQSVEQKIQTVSTSMASRLVEFTAALEQASAGVRNFDAAYADRIQAIALKVTQLTASLEGVGAIDIEERLEAIASSIEGLQGQWSIKIQTNDPANPIIAGIALSVEDPIAGPGTSSLVFMSEKFSFVTNNGTVMPFILDAGGLSLNGALRVNGTPVSEIAANYTWVKYGTNASGAGLTDNPDGMGYIGFAYNKPTAVESTNPADYAWSLMRGTNGDPIKGDQGEDGVTYYTWMKFSDLADGTGLYDTPTDSTLYIGLAVNKVSSTESTNKGDYVWTRFRGAPGVQGEKGDPGAVGSTGPRGTVEIAAATGSTVWSSAEANAVLISGGYGAPKFKDIVTLYNSAAKFSQTRFWDGDSWEVMTAYINGNMLVSGTVAADRIVANGITLLGEGVPLSIDYAAPETKNSEIIVGGRNLYPDSGFERGTHPCAIRSAVSNVQIAYIDNVGVNAGTKALFFEGPGGDMHVYTGGDPAPVVAGREYTISFYYKTATAGSITSSSAYFRLSDGNHLFIPLPYLNTQASMGGGVWVRHQQLWTCPAGITTIEPRFGVNCTGYAWMAVDCIQIEEGNKATQWMPAPEDFTVDAQVKADAAQAAAAADATAKANAAQAAAQAAATLGLADKLSKTGNEEIYGQKSLMSQYAMLVGTVNDGIIYGSTGLYGRNAGFTMFSIGANGRAIFADQLMAAWGTFGAVSIAAGGYLASGQTSYNTGNGFWLGGAGDSKFSIRTANGATFLCDPANNVLAMNGGSIGGTTTIDTFTVTIPAGNITGSGAAGYQPYGSRTVTVSGPTRGALTYSWMIFNGDSANGYADSRIIITGGSDTSVVTLAGTAGGPNGSDVLIGELICLVTDASGLSKSAKVGINRVHGSGAA